MADFGGETLDRGGDDAECREEHRMTVARDDLGRNRLRLQPERGCDMLLDARVDVGEGADGARNRAGRDFLAGGDYVIAYALPDSK